MNRSSITARLAATGLAAATALLISACNDGNSRVSAPVVTMPSVPGATTPPPVTPVMPPAAKTRVTLKGKIVDEPIANAAVVATVGGSTTRTVADSTGNYTLTVEVPNADAGLPLVVTATGVGDQASVKLVSLPGAVSTLVSDAGADGVLVPGENIRANVTHVSTAESALVMELAGGSPTSQAQLDGLLKQVDPVALFDLAAAIKLIVDTADYNLPAGVADTLAFAQNAAVRQSYIEEIKENAPEDLEQAKQETANSPDTTRGLTASDVPPTLLTALIDNDARVSVNQTNTVLRYAFDPAGTGTIVDSAGRSTTRWRIDGNRIVVDIDNPVVDEDRSSGELVRSTYQQVLLSFLSDTLVSTTFKVDVTYPETAGKPAGSRTETESDQILRPERDFAAFLPNGFATSGGKALTSSYLPVNGRGNVFAGDILSFNAGGKGTAQALAQSFDWSVSQAGVLALRYASGATLTLTGLNVSYRNQDANTVYVYAEVTDGGVRYADIVKFIQPSAALAFDAGKLPGEYYLYGLGNYEDGPELFDGRLMGFSLQLFDDRTGFQSTDRITAQNTVARPTLGTNPAGFFRWSLGANGNVVISRFFDATQPTSSAAYRVCDPASNANCQTYDRRELIPFAASGSRYYWVERRQVNNSGAVTSSTPTTYTVRFWDMTTISKAIVGSWEVLIPAERGGASKKLVVSFFGDGKYVTGGISDDPSCKSDNGGSSDADIEADGNGWEKGDYSWNPATGLITVSNVTETDGTCGISEGGKASFDDREYLSFKQDGTLGVKTQSSPDETPVDEGTVLRRVTSVSRQLTGAWLGIDGVDDGGVTDSRTLIYFLPGNKFLWVAAERDSTADAGCKNGGIVAGSTAFDPSTSVLRLFDYVANTYGECAGDGDVSLKMTFSDDNLRASGVGIGNDATDESDDTFVIQKITTP